MDRFFMLLKENKFKVKYDIEWTNFDTNSERFVIYSHIIELDCSYNQLTILPELPNVQKLDCSGNELTALPELPNVKILCCPFNQLTMLPELPNIQWLNCSYNGLTELPELPNVQKLDCSYNLLSTLPELPQITILVCYNNQLTVLPELPNMEEREINCCINNLFSSKLRKWKIIWKFKKTLIRVYLVPKLFSKWKLITTRHRLSVEHKEAIYMSP